MGVFPYNDEGFEYPTEADTFNPGDNGFSTMSMGTLAPNANGFSRRPQKMDQAEWERKQRLKEYRIASRREKRNRKSDEKKQRKLNATILRRMTRNPDKYNKNAGRNRIRAIEGERRKIQTSAIRVAQRLAAVHDPSGAKFNVGPVTTLEDGTVVSLEALERRKQKETEREAAKHATENGLDATHDSLTQPTGPPPFNTTTTLPEAANSASTYGGVNVNPERLKMLVDAKTPQPRRSGISKTQQKKLEAHVPKPPPPKPVIPPHVQWPSDEEENWLELWDLPDNELERRVLRAKKKAAAGRKALRIKQKTNKAERRAARDEKRRVYREVKQTWKVIKEEERRQKKLLRAIEDEERKRIADEVFVAERKAAMECCARLGFTLDNVEGVNDIKPRALGMKGVVVDFDKLELVGDAPSGLKIKSDVEKPKPKSNRVNLGAIADESRAKYLQPADGYGSDIDLDFVHFEDGHGEDFEAPNYNHRLRRKLRRAIEAAEVKKEMLVREKALDYCTANDIEVPPELQTPEKPVNERGQRMMPDGTLETAKQERVRMRVELTEFNNAARVLRKQAKELATEAGLRVYAELTGMIPRSKPMDMDVETTPFQEYMTNAEIAITSSPPHPYEESWPDYDMDTRPVHNEAPPPYEVLPENDTPMYPKLNTAAPPDKSSEEDSEESEGSEDSDSE